MSNTEIPTHYDRDVFINCPFDGEYRNLFLAIVFAVQDSGFRVRTALEAIDTGEGRLDKIAKIISECQYGVHDISRTNLDIDSLPRFNMPLELGLFLGCKKFGGGYHSLKRCLVLDSEEHRYQRFISDIAGYDIRSHDNKPKTAISAIRHWLREISNHKYIPGGTVIYKRYREYMKMLPVICEHIGYDIKDLHFADLTHTIYFG